LKSFAQGFPHFRRRLGSQHGDYSLQMTQDKGEVQSPKHS